MVQMDMDAGVYRWCSGGRCMHRPYTRMDDGTIDANGYGCGGVPLVQMDIGAGVYRWCWGAVHAPPLHKNGRRNH